MRSCCVFIGKGYGNFETVHPEEAGSQVVVVAAECREALSVVDDMKMCIAELEQENQIPTISVEALDGEVARIFTSSPRSEVSCMG